MPYKYEEPKNATPTFFSSVYAIRDDELGTYGDPLILQNDTVARRTFLIGLKSPNLQMSHFPELFHIDHIGLYDPVTGKITPNAPRKVDVHVV